MGKRVNWMSIVAVAFALSTLIAAVLEHYQYAQSIGLIAVTAAILAHLR